MATLGRTRFRFQWIVIWFDGGKCSTCRAGFKDVTNACCGSGRFNGKSGCTPNATLCDNRHEYLFWDLLHPTHAASKIAAAAIYDGSLHFAAPINFRQLVEDQC